MIRVKCGNKASEVTKTLFYRELAAGLASMREPPKVAREGSNRNGRRRLESFEKRLGERCRFPCDHILQISSTYPNQGWKGQACESARLAMALRSAPATVERPSVVEGRAAARQSPSLCAWAAVGPTRHRVRCSRKNRSVGGARRLRLLTQNGHHSACPAVRTK
jgi:hypothetical protein